MKPGEIYHSYREAKHPRAQIDVLAELNDVGVDVIEKIIAEEEAKCACNRVRLREKQEHCIHIPIRNAGARKMYDSPGYNIRHQIGSGSDIAFYLSLRQGGRTKTSEIGISGTEKGNKGA